MQPNSICDLEKSDLNQINIYLTSIGRKPFSDEFIEAIQNSEITDVIENTLGFICRGYFIDFTDSQDPEEAKMYGLVLNSVISGYYTDVLMLHPNFEPSGINQVLM